MNGALKHWDGPSRFVLRQHQPPSREPGQMLILLVTLKSFIHGLNCGHDLALAAVRQPVNDELLFRSGQTPGSERFATFCNLLGWVLGKVSEKYVGEREIRIGLSRVAPVLQ